MPITTQWDNDEQTIIRMVFQGRWTWEDLQAARDESISLSIASSQQRICLIVDMRNTSIMPDGAIQQARTAFRNPLPPNNLNFTVVVGANMFIEMFYNLLKRVFQAQMSSTFAMSSSLEEARTIIERRRAEAVSS